MNNPHCKSLQCTKSYYTINTHVDISIHKIVLLATRNLAKVLQKKAEIPVSGQTNSQIFFENATGNLVHLLNVCHPGRFSLSFPHSARFHGSVCPSNLGEYSLVRLLFFQNLHWVFGYGLQCWGPEETFWQHFGFRKLRFLLHNQFCRFLNFKNLSTPVLALFQGAFSQNFGNFKSCGISLFHKLLTIEKFPNFYFQ